MSKQDPGSNYTIAEGLSALSRTVATYYTAAVDHVNAESVSFAISCGVYASGFVATVQTSADNSSWADQTDDGSGNDVSTTFSAADFDTLNVPQPLNRFSRVKVVIGDTCVFGVVNISGPLLN